MLLLLVATHDPTIYDILYSINQCNPSMRYVEMNMKMHILRYQSTLGHGELIEMN